MKAIQSTVFVSLLLGSLSAFADQPVIHLSVGGEVAPGVYGEVQFGNAPPPPVVIAQPTIIERQPPDVVVQPIYLHVPPGHQRDWARHCYEYYACNRPVYFVRSREYEPDYRGERREERREERWDERREERRDERREERRDERREEHWDERREERREDR